MSVPLPTVASMDRMPQKCLVFTKNTHKRKQASVNFVARLVLPSGLDNVIRFPNIKGPSGAFLLENCC